MNSDGSGLAGLKGSPFGRIVLFSCFKYLSDVFMNDSFSLDKLNVLIIK